MKPYYLYCLFISLLGNLSFASEAALCVDGQCSSDVRPKVFLIGELHPDPDCTEFRQYIASRALEGAVLFGYEYSEEEGVYLADIDVESLHEERPEFFEEGTALRRLTIAEVLNAQSKYNLGVENFEVRMLRNVWSLYADVSEAQEVLKMAASCSPLAITDEELSRIQDLKAESCRDFNETLLERYVPFLAECVRVDTLWSAYDKANIDSDLYRLTHHLVDHFRKEFPPGAEKGVISAMLKSSLLDAFQVHSFNDLNKYVEGMPGIIEMLLKHLYAQNIALIKTNSTLDVEFYNLYQKIIQFKKVLDFSDEEITYEDCFGEDDEGIEEEASIDEFELLRKAIRDRIDGIRDSFMAYSIRQQAQRAEAMELPLVIILGHAHVPGVHQKLTALGVAHEVGIKQAPFSMLPRHASHARDFDLQKTQDTLGLLAECIGGDMVACEPLGLID